MLDMSDLIMAQTVLTGNRIIQGGIMNPLSMREISHLMRAILILSGTILIINGLYILLNFDVVFNAARSIFEKHISKDHHVSERNYLAINIYCIIAFLFIFGTIILSILHDTVRYKIKKVVFLDYACQSNSVVAQPIFTFLASSLGGLLIAILFILRNPLHIQRLYIEGPFEILSEVLLTISIFFMLKAVFRIRRRTQQESGNAFRWAFRFYIVLTVFMFLTLMEEISWGQTLLGWKTPAFFAEKNYQQETNLHNFFNPYFDSYYRLFTFLSIPVLISAFLQITPHKTRWYDLVLPHPSLIVLASLIFFFSVGIVKNELIEELLYLFIFFYSLRGMICSRFLTPELPSSEKKVAILQP